MIHLTLAIADFMWLLISSALWAIASVAGAALLALATLGGGLYACRKALHRRRG